MEHVSGSWVEDIEFASAVIAGDAGEVQPTVQLRVKCRGEVSPAMFLLDADDAFDVAVGLLEEAQISQSRGFLYGFLLSDGTDFDEVTRRLDEFSLRQSERVDVDPARDPVLKEREGVAVPVVDRLPALGRLAQLRKCDDVVYAWVGDHWEPVPMTHSTAGTEGGWSI